jgi:uncharacterized protein YacL
VDTYGIFVEKYGYFYSFLILLLSTLVFTSIYYLAIGKKTDTYSSVGNWFVFGLLNTLLIFIVTLSVLAFSLAEYTEFSEIPNDYWVFSIVNGLIYGFILYLIISLLMNNYSTNSKYIPFNLKK